MSECDREASIMRRPWPTRVLLCHRKILQMCEESESLDVVGNGTVIYVINKQEILVLLNVENNY